MVLNDQGVCSSFKGRGLGIWRAMFEVSGEKEE